MRTLKISIALIVYLVLGYQVRAQVPVLSSLPEASATLFLDFDGHTVEGTSWNSYGTSIVCAGSGLNTTQVKHVFNRVAEDYRPFQINVTTDSVKFLAAPVDRRMRVIITTTSSWYGNTAGGVAFVGSFTTGDDTPCFVFSALFGYNLKKISEAISHESGHTLGLYHQAEYDEHCNKITDYSAGQGSGEIGWAPIMGVGYSRNFTLWGYGPNSLGCTNYQSDLDIITSAANGFGYRNDDHEQDFDKATLALFANNQFTMEGIVSRNEDEDLFRFSMPGRGRFQLNAVPYNVGTGNAGSNLDMQITLYDESQQEVGIYNPGTLLSSVADTQLNPGVYYLKVEGKGNQYAPSYASLGSYSLSAIIEPGEPLPVHQLDLKAAHAGDLHQLHWMIDTDEPISHQSLEVSKDGRNFITLTALDGKTFSYQYRPDAGTTLHYRLLVHFETGQLYYSNTVSLNSEQHHAPKLNANVIQSDRIIITSPGQLQYRVVDMNGRIVGSGRLSPGLNEVTCETMSPGIYIIRIWDQHQQWTDKILRQ